LGLNPFRLSFLQAEEPLRFKPSVRVFDSFPSLYYAASLVTAPHNLTNPISHPLVGISHGARHAVFEVAKPSLQDRIDLEYDVRDAPAASSAEFLAKCIAELFAALFPRPFQPTTLVVTFEMIPQEIESTLSLSGNYPGLGRMQF